MATREREEIRPATGYLLGIGQVLQVTTVLILVFGQFLLQTTDFSMVVATAALVMSVGNFVVLYQLQNALFEDGTSEWRNWVG